MRQIADKYRQSDGTLDICKVSCIELDDCILNEGVDMEGYRLATPPLFVPRQGLTLVPIPAELELLYPPCNPTQP